MREAIAGWGLYRWSVMSNGKGYRTLFHRLFVQNVLNSHTERVGESREFFTVFQCSCTHLDINTLGRMMPKYYDPTTEEGSIPVL